MARALRVEYPGALYHVTSRGNRRQRIFDDDRDRELFLALVGEAARRYAWLINVYVLMTNHFLLVLETPEPNIALGMKWLNATYASWYNRRQAARAVRCGCAAYPGVAATFTTNRCHRSNKAEPRSTEKGLASLRARITVSMNSSVEDRTRTRKRRAPVALPELSAGEMSRSCAEVFSNKLRLQVFPGGILGVTARPLRLDRMSYRDRFVIEAESFICLSQPGNLCQ